MNRTILPLLAALTVRLSLLPSAAADASAGAAGAKPFQISLRTDRLEFVRGEAVTVSGTIRNVSQFAFVVDDYGPYLANTVTVYLRNSATGRLLLPRDGAPRSAIPTLTLLPGETRPFSIALAESFDLPPQGLFQATVVVARGEEQVASSPVAFSIVDGIEFGAAWHARAAEPDRRLRYALLYWERDKHESLYLRVTDPARGDRVLGFVSLGALVRVAEPTLRFLPDDVVEVVNQISRDRFARTRIDASGPELRILDRDDRWLNPEAVAEQVKTRMISDRLDRADAEKKEKEGGFFSRHKTRTTIPPADTSLAPKK